jgi:hypothetical protein
MTAQETKNALVFYNRMTNRNATELSELELVFISHIDGDMIKKTLVLTDTKGGSCAALGMRYGATKSQVWHWLSTNKKATTN